MQQYRGAHTVANSRVLEYRCAHTLASARVLDWPYTRLYSHNNALL